MKERPILFSAPMVRALLDGSKTQTRRVMSTQLVYGDVCGIFHSWYLPNKASTGGTLYPNAKAEILAKCPYGQPGDRLWVRETHRAIWGQSPGYLIGVDYKADPREKWERMRDHGGRPNWTPSIHMRREYSRILLEVVGVRLERLNECSAADAEAEGIKPHEVRQIDLFGAGPEERAEIFHRAALRPFEDLWEQINGAGSWAANPWVWVVEFERVTP